MKPPFTTAQFLDVISQYNGAVWPAHLLLYGLAGLMIYSAARGTGVVGNRLRFRFRRDVFGWTGAVLLGYALLLYPLLGATAGHPCPHGPTFGLPCPTTIATFGLLLWATPRVPLWVPAIPLVWSLIGTSAAFQFGIREDYGLLVAGVLGTTMVFVKNRRLPQADTREMAPA